MFASIGPTSRLPVVAGLRVSTGSAQPRVALAVRSAGPVAPVEEPPELPQAASASADSSDSATAGTDLRANLTGLTPSFGSGLVGVRPAGYARPISRDRVGSSSSRRPSPSRFTPTTNRARKTPGKTVIHHATVM